MVVGRSVQADTAFVYMVLSAGPLDFRGTSSQRQGCPLRT